MNTPPVDTRPPAPHVVKRDDSRPPSRANESQRRAFEKFLSEDEKEADPDSGAAAVAGAGADAGLRALSFLSKDDAGQAFEEEAAAAPLTPGGLSAAVPAEVPIDIPMPGFSPVVVQQAGLYPHLALPHGQSVEMGRFEVLGGSLVSGVTVETGALGGMTVTVGTSVQHASLLDRYLPQLQRRLPEKATAHVRVQERDQRRD